MEWKGELSGKRIIELIGMRSCNVLLQPQLSLLLCFQFMMEMERKKGKGNVRASELRGTHTLPCLTSPCIYHHSLIVFPTFSLNECTVFNNIFLVWKANIISGRKYERKITKLTIKVLKGRNGHFSTYKSCSSNCMCCSMKWNSLEMSWSLNCLSCA